MTFELMSKRNLIFGCGNPLFGDDGFGPAVIDYLQLHYPLPGDTAAVDAGTGVRDYLFDLLLSPVRPSNIYMVDAVSLPGKTPGELFELPLDGVPMEKATDFSLHQFPSVNLLSELNTLAHVKVLAVQAAHIPDCVEPGLSSSVRNAVWPACDWLLQKILN